MPPKPLGRITAILAELALEVSYAYDDLIFVQHATFLLQFTEDPDQLKLFIREECNHDQANLIVSNIILAFDTAGFSILPSGRFSLAQNKDETIRIHGLETTQHP